MRTETKVERLWRWAQYLVGMLGLVAVAGTGVLMGFSSVLCVDPPWACGQEQVVLGAFLIISVCLIWIWGFAKMFTEGG
jgi:hypothetical protein